MCNVNMYIVKSIHISKYLVVHNVFSLNYSIQVVIFFLNPGTSELFMKISTKNVFVFYWIEDSKTYAHADA